MLGLGKDELDSFGRRGIGGICDEDFWDGVGILERVSHFLRKRRIVRSIFKILQGVEFELS